MDNAAAIRVRFAVTFDTETVQGSLFSREQTVTFKEDATGEFQPELASACLLQTC